MFHTGASDPNRSILQVELNTISSSFGCLSSQISDMHRLLCPSTPGLKPVNDSCHEIAKCMIAAYDEYNRQRGSEGSRDCVILFIVQVYTVYLHTHITTLG